MTKRKVYCEGCWWRYNGGGYTGECGTNPTYKDTPMERKTIWTSCDSRNSEYNCKEFLSVEDKKKEEAWECTKAAQPYVITVFPFVFLVAGGLVTGTIAWRAISGKALRLMTDGPSDLVVAIGVLGGVLAAGIFLIGYSLWFAKIRAKHEHATNSRKEK